MFLLIYKKGGHGKRSEIPTEILPVEASQDKPYSNINKEIFVSKIIFRLDKNILILFFCIH